MAMHEKEYCHGAVGLDAFEVVLQPNGKLEVSADSLRTTTFAQARYQPDLVGQCADSQIPSLPYFDSKHFSQSAPDFPPEGARYLGYRRVQQKGKKSDESFNHPVENFYALDMYNLGIMVLKLALPINFKLPNPKSSRDWSVFLSLRMAQGSMVLRELEHHAYTPAFQAIIAQLLQTDFSRRPSADVALASCGFLKVLHHGDQKPHSTPRHRSEPHDESSPKESSTEKRLLKVTKPPKIQVVSSYAKRNSKLIRKSLQEKSDSLKGDASGQMKSSLQALSSYYVGTAVEPFMKSGRKKEESDTGEKTAVLEPSSEGFCV